MKSSAFYFLCAVPDLILKKVPASVPASSTGAGSALNLDESVDVIEIKQSQAVIGKTADCRHIYVQVFAQLLFLATGFLVKSLRSSLIPREVSGNGLCISKSGQIVLFKLKIKIGQITNCQLQFEVSKVIRPSLPIRSLISSDVCADFQTD